MRANFFWKNKCFYFFFKPFQMSAFFYPKKFYFVKRRSCCAPDSMQQNQPVCSRFGPKTCIQVCKTLLWVHWTKCKAKLESHRPRGRPVESLGVSAERPTAHGKIGRSLRDNDFSSCSRRSTCSRHCLTLP